MLSFPKELVFKTISASVTGCYKVLSNKLMCKRGVKKHSWVWTLTGSRTLAARLCRAERCCCFLSRPLWSVSVCFVFLFLCSCFSAANHPLPFPHAAVGHSSSLLSSNPKLPLSASRRWSVQTLHDWPVLSSSIWAPIPVFWSPPPSSPLLALGFSSVFGFNFGFFACHWLAAAASTNTSWLCFLNNIKLCVLDLSVSWETLRADLRSVKNCKCHNLKKF